MAKSTGSKNTDDIEMCISALAGLKVARDAYGPSAKYVEIRDSLAEALRVADRKRGGLPKYVAAAILKCPIKL
jgi:hypothetical protein